jgi:hypothetical protein
VNRRTILASTGTAVAASVAGCLDWASNDDLSIDFETSDDASRSDADSQPTVTVENSKIVVRGTVTYRASCGTIELAHSEYTPYQDRLDLLVVSTNEPQADPESCSLDNDVGTYRIEVSGWNLLRYVSVTEHHYDGEIYSTTHELDI